MGQSKMKVCTIFVLSIFALIGGIEDIRANVNEDYYDILRCDTCTSKILFSEAALKHASDSSKLVIINMNTLVAVCFEKSENVETKTMAYRRVESFDGIEETVKELKKLNLKLKNQTTEGLFWLFLF